MNITYDKFNMCMVDKKFVDACLFVCVSGSHSFGWKTDKSDLDLRFVVMPELSQIISPFYPMKTRQHIENKDTDNEIDITEYPISHFLVHLAKGNGNFVDNLFEPKLYEWKEEVKELQDIVKSHIHKGFIDHCLGYSKHIKNDLSNETRLEKYGKSKLLLTRYRTLMQGFALLDGKIEYNMDKLYKVTSDIFSKLPITVRDNYVKGIVDNDLLNYCITDTDDLDYLLMVERDTSSLPDRHKSTIDVLLDRWLRDRYIAKPYGVER